MWSWSQCSAIHFLNLCLFAYNISNVCFSNRSCRYQNMKQILDHKEEKYLKSQSKNYKTKHKLIEVKKQSRKGERQVNLYSATKTSQKPPYRIMSLFLNPHNTHFHSRNNPKKKHIKDQTKLQKKQFLSQKKSLLKILNL